MGETRLVVPEGLACMALREFLQKECGFSTTLWKKLRRSDTFSLNGHPANAARARIKSGDELCWHLTEESRIAPEDIPLDILYEDTALLIINKPAGMLIHPTGGEHHHTLANAVLFHYETHGEKHAFHPVHRLDRQTSGLVLIAKEPHIQHRLSKHDAIERIYLAVIEGVLPKPCGTIDLPIARRRGSIIERMIAPEGKRAVTHYATLVQTGGLSLLALRLSTGRTHQIRVHLAHLGHPLLGDDLYGKRTNRLRRQALHACNIRFRHPSNGEDIKVHAPLPADMSALFPEISADSLFSQKIHDVLIKL
ncbi:RluA family pseudouridine synthase [Selenomonas sp.]|uniref:RluA family pseudouridine synthase n=1 Tax=Selenomonas sp. TaxID=2053611 RepID=UPI003FA23EED